MDLLGERKQPDLSLYTLIPPVHYCKTKILNLSEVVSCFVVLLINLQQLSNIESIKTGDRGGGGL